MHCLNVRTVLYDFITYCELFHADIRSRIDKDAASSAMGLVTRNLWIEAYLRDVDYRGYNRDVLRNRRAARSSKPREMPYHPRECRSDYAPRNTTHAMESFQGLALWQSHTASRGGYFEDHT